MPPFNRHSSPRVVHSNLTLKSTCFLCTSKHQSLSLQLKVACNYYKHNSVFFLPCLEQSSKEEAFSPSLDPLAVHVSKCCGVLCLVKVTGVSFLSRQRRPWGVRDDREGSALEVAALPNFPVLCSGMGNLERKHHPCSPAPHPWNVPTQGTVCFPPLIVPVVGNGEESVGWSQNPFLHNYIANHAVL